VEVVEAEDLHGGRRGLGGRRGGTEHYEYRGADGSDGPQWRELHELSLSMSDMVSRDTMRIKLSAVKPQQVNTDAVDP